jgi:glycosyltransferase involved in cell wall biosynthesis
VEFASVSGEYAWTTGDVEVAFRHVTLHENGPSAQCSTRDLRERLSRCLDDFQPDAVAVPGWSGRLAFAALQWCLRRGVPAIAMSESTAHDQPRKTWRESIKRRCLATCSAGLIGGPPHRDYLVQLGMPSDAIFDGYDVVDNIHFERGAAEARQHADAIRKRLKLPVAYLLASARFIEKKNLATLLRAYAEYRTIAVKANQTAEKRDAAAPWELVLLGDGRLRDSLELLSAQLGIERSVHFPGFQQYAELPNYYGLASAFIHPSKVEQWGLVVNEAMASGLPVLVSDKCGCVPTLVHPGVNGNSFSPSDANELCDAMVRLWRLPEGARRAMGDASAKIVRDYGPAQFASGLGQAAKAAFGRHAARRRVIDSLFVSVLLATAR